VTRIGARDQIERRLLELDRFKDFRGRELNPFSMYCANLTLESLGEVFTSAADTMAWLSECAKTIATTGEAVEWTMPLGLPVVQPYRKTTSKSVKTILQNVSLEFSDEASSKVSIRKQAQGFPPNYVHSLDSSHMMLTATACHKEGITFAAVHDSFWTHACDVPRMNALLREQFVKLHQRPLLEELLESFRSRYPDVDWDAERLQPPKQGSLELARVRESDFFFS